MSWWEPEEAIGHLWHRFVGNAASYPHHPEAAVSFAEMRTRVAVFYRGVGGAGGVTLTTGSRTSHGHRLTWRQRVGLGSEEWLERARFDGESLLLPERLAYFPQRELNEKLYFWLAAFCAHAPAAIAGQNDPVCRDVHVLQLARMITSNVIRRWPGLASTHATLAHAVHAVRPRRALAGWEAAIEEVIVHMLSGEMPASPEGRQLLATVENREADLTRLRAPPGYRPFLPLPLWAEIKLSERVPNTTLDEETGGGGADTPRNKRLKARRRPADQTERRDPLVLYRFEHIPTLEEMANLSRAIEEDDADSARKAADAMDEITLGSTERQAGTRLKLDLELAPRVIDTVSLKSESTYPEWDYTRQRYHPDHCRVIAELAQKEGTDWQPDARAHRRIRAVRRRFEALRPQRQLFRAQPDGDDLDLNALVRSVADSKAGSAGSDRVYTCARDARRDLAVAILVDASLSTDSWVGNRRVLDVEKEALLALTHGLSGCGDAHAIFAFTSRKRQAVHVHTIKDFHEPLDGRVHRRIEALRPGYYTRIGAALRHTAVRLNEQPNRHRLLLLLTDGKPNDFDYYEGRYGVEDTRRAVREARRSGLAVFGVTVDSKARDYFPYLFGRGAYAIVSRIDRLPAALPAIYRQITG